MCRFSLQSRRAKDDWVCHTRSIVEWAILDWQIRFRRMLGPEEVREWTKMQSLLSEVSLNAEANEIAWGLSSR
jgi:hypothetical protein